MSQDSVGEIRINRRLLRIGDQIYPLANIARVQTLWIEWQPKTSPAGGILLGIAVIAYILSWLGFDLPVSNTLVVIAGIVGVIWFGISDAIARPKRRFLLVIETNGAQTAVLASTVEPEIRKLEHAVVNAIENPPSQEQVLKVSGDIVFGDKIDRDKILQHGSGNSAMSSG